MIKKYFVCLLIILLIMICGSSSLKAQEILYSVLKLDFNSTHNNDAVETEPNFTAFIIADSGREVDGIKITIESVNMDARRRAAPTGVPYEQIYRDFIFFRHFRPGTVMAYPYTGATEPITVTLSGLVPNQDYEITIYSFDTSSGGVRYANWTANGEFLFQTVMSQANGPTPEDSGAFREWTKADNTGKIVLVATIADEQLADQAQFNQPFAFINALTVYARIPRFMALRPTPAIGTTVTTAAVQLQWNPGVEAVKHNVYFGETFADVDTATTANTNVFRGAATSSSFD
ncbi:MAG: hypothetical protein MUP16_03165, partial [Sedimentisphaerales bacterium]|nr:hypothetical protein [Sedimentisphaerales bacterium]